MHMNLEGEENFVQSLSNSLDQAGLNLFQLNCPWPRPCFTMMQWPARSINN